MKIFNLISNLFLIIALSGCATKYSTSLFSDDLEKERMLLMANNYHELIQIYKDKLRESEDPLTRLKLAQLYFNVDDFNSANYYLEPLLKDESKGTSKESQNNANKTKQDKQEKEQYKQHQAYLLKAKILETNKQYNESIKMANKAIELNNSYAEAFNIRGIVQALQGQLNDATGSFLRAKDLFMDDYILNTNMGTISLLKQDYKEAIHYLEPLYVRGYNNITFLHNYVFCLVKLNRIDDAKMVLNREGISKFPNKLIDSIKEAKLQSNTMAVNSN